LFKKYLSKLRGKRDTDWYEIIVMFNDNW